MVDQNILEQLKPWIVRELSTSPDLDSNDMADYVLALLQGTGTRNDLYNSCCNDLEEFLHLATKPFVDKLFIELDRLENCQNEDIQNTSPNSAHEGYRRNFRRGKNLENDFHPTSNNNSDRQIRPLTQHAQVGNSGTNLQMPFPLPPGFPSVFQMPPFEMMFQGPPNSRRSFAPRNRRGGNTSGHSISNLSSVNNELHTANKKLVVEKIPEDRLNETDIRTYFSKFGNLKSVRINSKGSYAEIEYETHDQAVAAHGSPDPIFDNRFIKVYWRKKDDSSFADLDVEDLKRMQAIKQQKFEEKLAKKREHQAKMQQLMEQRTRLLQAQEALLQTGAEIDQTTLDEQQKVTDSLRRQLEELKAEARSLGLSGFSESARGRGGYRGRASRLRPYGMYRGRGGIARASLDLRPKSIMIHNVPMDKDEAFRSHIVSVSHNSLTRRDANTLVVDFNDRKSAEVFMNNVNSIPEVGILEKSWVSRDINTDTEMN